MSTRVWVTAAQRDYLREAAFLPADLRALVRSWSDGATTNDKIEVEVASDVAERFGDLFTTRLTTVGFGLGYDLTAEGQILEDLIDAFVREHE